MDDDKRRIYELMRLVDAQKTKINTLGKRVEVAHKQRLKKIPSRTMLKVLLQRLWQRLSFHHH